MSILVYIFCGSRSGLVWSRSGLVQVWFSLQPKFNSCELDSEVGRLVSNSKANTLSRIYFEALLTKKYLSQKWRILGVPPIFKCVLNDSKWPETHFGIFGIWLSNNIKVWKLRFPSPPLLGGRNHATSYSLFNCLLGRPTESGVSIP